MERGLYVNRPVLYQAGRLSLARGLIDKSLNPVVVAILSSVEIAKLHAGKISSRESEAWLFGCWLQAMSCTST